mgnify:CR=1 FL=1
MYIEVICDAQGGIIGCWQSDLLPETNGEPLVTFKDGLPPACSQSRINIDTMTAMEIDAESKRTGVDRAEYIRRTFKVNINKEITIPLGVVLKGINIKEFTRK